MKYNILYFMVLFLLITILSCQEDQPSYEEQFGLHQYKLRQYDLYNPILNSLKIDSTARKSHPKFYDFDAYYDSSDRLRYLFFKGSYSYLHEFFYNSNSKLSKVKIYPILVSSIHKTAKIMLNNYYYDKNNNLIVIRDNFNMKLLFVNGYDITIYDGILAQIDSLKITHKNADDFYTRLWY